MSPDDAASGLADPTVDATPDVPEAAAPAPATGAGARKRKARRKPVRRALIWSHRWFSIVLGIALLLVTTSGAVLLYAPELNRLAHASAYAASGGPQSVTFGEALEAAQAVDPEFVPGAIIAENGVLRVTDYERSITVDPATGAVLGDFDGAPAYIEFFENLHLCALACEDHPGYIAALATEIPGTEWLGWDAPITVAMAILGVLGILLLFLSISGLWLWWPKRNRVKQSMSVRWSKGRFARDTDLHKVAGMVALPLLMVWALTGMGWELKPVTTIWDTITPGVATEWTPATSAEGEGPDISVDEAVAAVERDFPGGPVVSLELPAADDPTAAYFAYTVVGIDPWAGGEWPGNFGVSVDRRTGETTERFSSNTRPWSQFVWDDWGFGVHSGWIVNGWWRIIWLVLGLSPLLLAFTGLSTWLVRRKTRKVKTAARAAAVRAGDLVVADAIDEQIAHLDAADDEAVDEAAFTPSMPRDPDDAPTP